MSAASVITKKTFNKIFNNLSAKVNQPLDNLKIGIFYENGEPKYYAYSGVDRIQVHPEKDQWNFDPKNFIGTMIDWSGGTEVIKATIEQAGQRYSKEYDCSVDDVSIIMKPNDGKLPLAVLLVNNEKKQEIDIKQDFLT